MLVGLEAAGHRGAFAEDAGAAAVAGYLAIYALLVLGTFAAVALVVAMWLRDAAGPAVAVPPASRVVLVVCVAATLGIGIVPGWFLDLLADVASFAS